MQRRPRGSDRAHRRSGSACRVGAQRKDPARGARSLRRSCRPVLRAASLRGQAPRGACAICGRVPGLVVVPPVLLSPLVALIITQKLRKSSTLATIPQHRLAYICLFSLCMRIALPSDITAMYGLVVVITILLLPGDILKVFKGFAATRILKSGSPFHLIATRC